MTDMPICPHCGGEVTTAVTVDRALDGLDMAERAFAERDRLRESNAELVTALEAAAYELDITADFVGSDDIDSSRGLTATAKAIRSAAHDARAAIARAEPPG